MEESEWVGQVSTRKTAEQWGETKWQKENLEFSVFGLEDIRNGT